MSAGGRRRRADVADLRSGCPAVQHGASALGDQRSGSLNGRLVTKDKILTDRAVAAVHAMHEVGIALALTSARPPRGQGSRRLALHAGRLADP
jgi:hypothetical protein